MPTRTACCSSSSPSISTSALVPVLVEQLALLPDQPVPAGQLGGGQRGLDLVADRGVRPARRPAVGEELGQLQHATGRDPGREGVPGQVAAGLDVLGAGVGDLEHVVHAGGDAQAAAPGPVHQHGTPSAGDRQLALQGLGERRRGPRVVAAAAVAGLVGQQVRLQGHVEVAEVVGDLDLVLDGGDGPADERDQPGAGDPHRAATRRLPLRRPPQDTPAQIERAPVLDDLAVVEVERGVLDQQPDQLAVGHVDDRLPHLGEPVAGLGMGQRPLLEEPVEVRARDDDRLALLERSAHADVPVGQREDRLVDAERGVVEADLGQRPRLDREGGAPLRHDRSPSSSDRSWTTTSAPISASCCGLPHPVHPDHEPEVARPARGDTGQRVLVDHRLGRLDAERPRAGEEGVRLRLAAQAVARRDHAVDADVDEVGEPAGGDDLRAVRRRGHDGGGEPGLLDRPQVADRALVDLDAVLLELAEHQLVLAGGDGLHRRRVGGVARGPLRQHDAAAGEEPADAVGAVPAVDVGVVVGLGELTRPRVVGPEELVERAFPGGEVHGRRAREHAVEVEEAGADGVR